MSHRVDRGLGNEFIKQMGRSLRPVKSALRVLTDEEHAEGAIEYLRSFEIEMHVAEISEETEDVLGEVAEDEAATQAVDVEFSAE